MPETQIVGFTGAVRSVSYLLKQYSESKRMRINRFIRGWRSDKRLRADYPIRLVWRDRHGEGFILGKCRNICSGGIGIECIDPVPLKAELSVYVEDQLAATARVCYHAKRGAGYIIGLAFTTKTTRREIGKRSELDLAIHGMTW